jgi:O-antigen/teichoic acid export membrane protein
LTELRKFLSRSFLISLSTAGGYALGLAALPFISRLFSPASFGLWAAFVAIATLISFFATLRIENIIILPKGDRPAEALTFALLVSCAGVGIASTAACVLIWLLAKDHMPIGAGAFWLLLGPAAGAMGSGQALRAWALRRSRYAAMAWSSVVRGATFLCAALLLGNLLDGALVALLLAQVAAEAFALIPLSLPLRDFPRRGSFWKVQAVAVVRRHRAMIAALSASQLLSSLYAPMAVIGVNLAASAHVAGYFAMSERLLTLPAMLLGTAVGEVFRQRVAKAWHAGESLQRPLMFTRLAVFGISTVGFGLGLWAAEPMIPIIFGPGWEGLSDILFVLWVPALLSVVAGSTDRAAVVAGMSRYITAWHSLRFVIELSCAMALTTSALEPSEYILALAVGRTLAYLVEIVYVPLALSQIEQRRFKPSAPRA